MISGNIGVTGFGYLQEGNIQKAIEIMKELNANSVLGKTEIDGKDFYYTVMETDVHPLSELKYEMQDRKSDV